MSEWKEIELFQIMEIVKNQFQADKNSDFKYIGLEHIEQESLRLNSFGHSSEVSSNKFFFKKGDILFGKLRPYFRKVIKVKFDGVCSTDIWVIRAKDAVFQDYLFYFLANWEFINIANAGEGGSRMPRADWNFLKNTKWLIPNPEEQKAIAEVLTSLDDKIDLLHKQNKTLEQLAETLFRHHFIDNAQDDWEEKPLKDVCLIRNGFAFKSESYQESGQKIIRTTNFCNGFVELGNDVVFISDELAQSFNAYHLDRKDFLLVMVGASLGNFAVVTKDILPALQNQNMWCFRAKEEWFQHYLNHAIRVIISENLHGASGSARSFFQKGSFYEQMIRVPDRDSLNEFHHLSENLFSRLELNRFQIKSLEKLRDQLLPKLMSGEIDVIKMEDLCTK